MQHVLKNDPALRDLWHVQVDGPGLVCLFFYNRHGHHSLSREAALAMHLHYLMPLQSGLGDHFDAVSLLLEEGCQCVMAAQESHRQHIWPQKPPIFPIQASGSTSSRSLQLVGGVPPVPEAQDGAMETEMPKANEGTHDDAKPDQDQFQGEEEDHHLPHWNILKGQTLMTTQQPLSRVETTDIEGTNRHKADWHL